MDFSLLTRSYDLRGIYGVDIDDDFFYRLGYAFAKVTEQKRIALGYDARISSPTLKDAFTDGANLAGATIIDIGMCSSDMLSFATCHYDDIGAGVMITASHNPKQYNGMKSLSHTWEPYNLKKYGPAMVEIMQSLSSPWKELTMTNEVTSEGFSGINKSSIDLNNAQHMGHSTFVGDIFRMVEHRNVLSDWIDQILRFTSSGADFSKYSIVADWGNGVAGIFMSALATQAQFKLIPLFLDPDGNFPNHHPNPMHEKNREDARVALLEHHADVAFIFDGDADRVILLDETGEQINSAIVSTIIAESLLQDHPRAAFIGNAVTSHNFRDFVVAFGARYVREKVGHVYIRETMMLDPDIVFAWEHSAHYFFRENYFMDSGIVAAMLFLYLLARSGKRASEFIASYRQYITLEESNFEVKNPKWAIEKLTQIYAGEQYDLFDGITVEYADGSWWNFRPSSNEPLLRLNMEAKTQDRFDALYSEIMTHIQAFGSSSEK